MKKTIIVFLVAITFSFLFRSKTLALEGKATFWKFQAIDTMKYSRDIAREKSEDQVFDEVISAQVMNIAKTGATHIAIATPYDEEFQPYLRRWVSAARRNHLKVWFRGNWSGWEQWFDYPKISRDEHIQKTYAFIINHADLFEDGDVFSACPECENGGPGDPRLTGDVKGHRAFLIDEYTITKKAFKEIHKEVASNYASMNGDVARLVMDKDTTKRMDGLVVIDHYVKNSSKLVSDIRDISMQSGGSIILGEFGAPIPDIHGSMNEQEQSVWLRDTFVQLIPESSLKGLSYWVNVGGSTELWNSNGTARAAVKTISDMYNPRQITSIVKDEIGRPIENVTVVTNTGNIHTDTTGGFILPVIEESGDISFSANGYQSRILKEQEITPVTILVKNETTIWYRCIRFLRHLFRLQ